MASDSALCRVSRSPTRRYCRRGALRARGRSVPPGRLDPRTTAPPAQRCALCRGCMSFVELRDSNPDPLHAMPRIAGAATSCATDAGEGDGGVPFLPRVMLRDRRHGATAAGARCARGDGQYRRVGSIHERHKPPAQALRAVPGGHVVCGAEGTRTPDPLHAMQVRYQLRHSPRCCPRVEAPRTTRGILANGSGRS